MPGAWTRAHSHLWQQPSTFSVPRACTGTVVFAGLYHWMPDLHRNRVPHQHKPLSKPNYDRDAAHSCLDDESRCHSRICGGLLPV